ncbi:MAG: biotin--[acetyl-CoA-carboxylase] ligase [Actinomycetota bacterium]|nr:biotin--[acetyl-CoA-carboxylase] ligase [Actinomycetota bacterium]
MTAVLGRPRLHVRSVDSTSRQARELAAAGAPHGTLVTATEQTAGRGRQGRTWSAPPGRALLMSLLLREWPGLLPLAAAAAVAEAVGETAMVKWPNDVQIFGRKVAGILAEGRPQAGWMILGIGLNVAVRLEDLPPELRDTAGTLGLAPSAVEPNLARVIDRLQRWLTAPPAAIVAAVRARDALAGRDVRYGDFTGRAHGIDDQGRLLVLRADGVEDVLDAGEVHLTPSSSTD